MFQLAGPDSKGALARITRQLMDMGCEVRSMAVSVCVGGGGGLRGIVCPLGCKAAAMADLGERAGGRTHAGGWMAPWLAPGLQSVVGVPTQVWSYKQRAAAVIAARDSGHAVFDADKLARLKRFMHSALAAGGHSAVVSVDQVGAGGGRGGGGEGT